MARNYYCAGIYSKKQIRLAQKLFRKAVAKGKMTDSKSVWIGYWTQWGQSIISYDDEAYKSIFLGRVILKKGVKP